MNQSQVTSILRRLNIIERTIEPLQQDQQDQQDYCSICLEELENVGLVTLRCGHKLHLTCYTTLVSNRNYSKKCPLCRDNIHPQSVHFEAPDQIFEHLTPLQQCILNTIRSYPQSIRIIRDRLTSASGQPESAWPISMQRVINIINILIGYRLVQKVETSSGIYYSKL